MRGCWKRCRTAATSCPKSATRAVGAIFETRLILECAIAELACLRASDGDLEDLARLGRPAPAPAPKGERDFAGIIQANSDFHVRLARTTRNRELVDLLIVNLEKTERLMYLELRGSHLRRDRVRAPARAHCRGPCAAGTPSGRARGCPQRHRRCTADHAAGRWCRPPRRPGFPSRT